MAAKLMFFFVNNLFFGQRMMYLFKLVTQPIIKHEINLILIFEMQEFLEVIKILFTIKKWKNLQIFPLCNKGNIILSKTEM
jgi:hypothetical protein